MQTNIFRTGPRHADHDGHGVAADDAAIVAALDCLRVGVCLLDRESRLTWTNAHLAYLFRSLREAGPLTGVHHGAMLERIVAGGEIAPEELRDGIADFVARFMAQLSPGRYAPADMALADGRVIEVKARAARPDGWIILWTDVTERRRMSQRLESALALSTEAFAFYDRADRLVECSPGYADLIGRDADAITGMSFPEIVNLAVQTGRYVTDNGPAAWVAERIREHQHPTGAMTVRTIDGVAVLIRDRRTPDGGRVSVMTDVSDKRRIEAALAEQTEALSRNKEEMRQQQRYLADLTNRLSHANAEAESAKATFLRTMSHELKTPLNAIIGFSDLMGQMADQIGQEQVREYSGLIHQAGNNLLRLIHQILDLTKLAGGRYPLNRQRVDAARILWDAREALATRAGARNVTLDGPEAGEGYIVHADPGALETMFTHLIENAVQFTQPGGTVQMRARRDGAHVVVTVADDGPGVMAQDMERILQPFGQAGAGPAERGGGAGLGLTLVKGLAELHGGSLAIRSESGAGFCAILTFEAIAE